MSQWIFVAFLLSLNFSKDAPKATGWTSIFHGDLPSDWILGYIIFWQINASELHNPCLVIFQRTWKILLSTRTWTQILRLICGCLNHLDYQRRYFSNLWNQSSWKFSIFIEIGHSDYWVASIRRSLVIVEVLKWNHIRNYFPSHVKHQNTLCFDKLMPLNSVIHVW